MISRRKLLGLVTALISATKAPTQEERSISEVAVQNVTWDPVKLMFCWESAIFHQGEKPNFQPFKINFRDQTMHNGDGEVRYFTYQEAEEVVNKLLKKVTMYAAESSIWWKEGKGKERPQEPLPKPEPIGSDKSNVV